MQQKAAAPSAKWPTRSCAGSHDRLRTRRDGERPSKAAPPPTPCPNRCRCVVDFRLPDLRAADELVDKMQTLRPVGPDMELEIDVEVNRPPMVKDQAVEALLARAQASARHAGFTLEDAPMTGGGSDANFTSAMGVPTGLAPMATARTLHEHILVSTLEARLNFWRHLLAHLA